MILEENYQFSLSLQRKYQMLAEVLLILPIGRQQFPF